MKSSPSETAHAHARHDYHSTDFLPEQDNATALLQDRQFTHLRAKESGDMADYVDDLHSYVRVRSLQES
jgi:hypothetical protein